VFGRVLYRLIYLLLLAPLLSQFDEFAAGILYLPVKISLPFSQESYSWLKGHRAYCKRRRFGVA